MRPQALSQHDVPRGHLVRRSYDSPASCMCNVQHASCTTQYVGCIVHLSSCSMQRPMALGFGPYCLAWPLAAFLMLARAHDDRMCDTERGWRPNDWTRRVRSWLVCGWYLLVSYLVSRVSLTTLELQATKHQETHEINNCRPSSCTDTPSSAMFVTFSTVGFSEA